MKTNLEKLPANWSSTTVGESCEIIAGYGFPEKLQGRLQGDLPFYKVGDISEAWKAGSTHLSKANHYVSFQDLSSLKAKPLPPSTTVFAKIGAAIALNRRAMLSVPGLVDNNVMGLHANNCVLDPAFLFYFTWTLRLGDISQATTVPSIRKSDVEKIEVPLPPLAEQGRIVAEIEKQFTRLDAALVALNRAQANLDRLRQAILKRAFEGKLVSQDSNDEPAGTLLERIRGTGTPGCAPEQPKGRKRRRRASKSGETVHG